MITPSESDLRFDKHRADAVVRLSSGESIIGSFFVGAVCARHSGPERIADLLNGEAGFFPFEVRDEVGVRIALYNRAHVVTVTVAGDEPSHDPGYGVAPRRSVSLLLSTGQRLNGAVRIHRPEGQHRLSDWARDSDIFHYLETDAFTFIVNAAHIVEVSEALES